MTSPTDIAALRALWDRYESGGVWEVQDDAALFSALPSLLDEVEALREALATTMIGGNHLANVLVERLGGGFAKEYPPDGESPGYGEDSQTIDIWHCWASIMRARAAIGRSKP